MNLKGKVAIVTGGNSGIGLAIVLELARQGANIVIDYVVHPETAEALEQQVRALGDQAIGVHADVSQVAELETLIAAAVDAFGRVDIMVNNAGVETRTSILDTTEEQYEKVLAINLKSAFFGTQLAARQMIKQGGGGRIINITSVHEDWPMPGNTPIACPRAACACSRAPPASNSRRTGSWSSASVRAPLPRRSIPPP
jgi:glucose 1-dehydrogenase